MDLLAVKLLSQVEAGPPPGNRIVVVQNRLPSQVVLVSGVGQADHSGMPAAFSTEVGRGGKIGWA